jgi:hypothetical protein
MGRISCTIIYGKTDIKYELFIVNRKSLEIAVHPDKSIIVKAPKNISMEIINERVKKRARWISKQINYFDQFDLKTPKRQFIGGESHLYLGRKYRLKIEESLYDRVLLKNGYFFIESTSIDTCHIKDLLQEWYNKHSKIYLSNVLDKCWDSFNKDEFRKPNLKVQKMEKRWGSLSAKGQITLNVNLIQTPRECIEYVIIHELCHLRYNNHGAEFYNLLDKTMPDWIKRKHKLEMSLI